MTSNANRIKQLLRRRVLENITPLKMLEAYGACMSCRLLEQEGRWGVLLLLPTSVFPYDAKTYPDATHSVFLAGTDEELLGQLVDELPFERPLVFKVQRPEYETLLRERLPLERKRAFHTYSIRIERLIVSPNGNVPEERQLNESLLPLWMANGYTREELLAMFAGGARSYTLYEWGMPASTCLTFPNYGDVWEIGAVHTTEAHRGKGLAAQVVTTAAASLLAEGRIPRYHVEEGNTASIKLADKLGFTHEVELAHWYYDGKRI
ncbi:GNAT family N-acetyltransferase [Paenibacillus methanolicus]|uniref:FR47-like protein n=1 Tax=Paenibacillus methanolicus TaxID=582686 RepID=A0A5S5BVU0_9BACL|nr:GNAT family N-acetyltransferase [Paenibacillus methanolicus]TYP69723.1 FR47-like protein [Paenibacillus methanolicus]